MNIQQEITKNVIDNLIKKTEDLFIEGKLNVNNKIILIIDFQQYLDIEMRINNKIISKVGELIKFIKSNNQTTT